MRLPKSLKIGGHKISVIEAVELTNNADGQWDPRANTISVQKDLPPSQKEVTLIHEILHSINISLSETDVEFLAQAMYQVLVDNKLTFDGKDE